MSKDPSKRGARKAPAASAPDDNLQRVSAAFWAEDMEGALTLAQVVGQNVRRLREQLGWSQEEAAIQLQAQGTTWTKALLASLESGRREGIELGGLLQLAWAFDVPLAEFFDGGDDIRINDHMLTDAGAVRMAVSGEPFAAQLSEEAQDQMTTNQLMGADAALARRLAIDTDTVIATARELWGRTLTEQRDSELAEREIVNELSLPIYRGHITKRLSKELEKALDNAESGGKR